MTHLPLHFATLLAWRRDVRRFRRDALPDGLVESLLEQAELAPSVGYSQPWRWVRVEADEQRVAVQESFQRCNAEALADYEGERARLYAGLKLTGLKRGAGADRGVLRPWHGAGPRARPQDHAGDARLLRRRRDYPVLAGGAGRGVGLGWVSILEPDTVRQALGAPADWKLIAYLCLGWPEDEQDVPELVRAGWETSTGSLRR